ncbi:MAG: PTS sugar transporter subunit IIA [Gammaproteobacteria bacterium WSBS_2016_MAG_OTU1]
MKDMLGVILLTQQRYGETLLETARFVSDSHIEATTLSLLGNESRGEIESRLLDAVSQFDTPVLVLCDLFGSTHAVIAADVAKQNKKVACVCGVNLPMLMEAHSARHRSLTIATEQVAKAGRRAIVVCGLS